MSALSILAEECELLNDSKYRTYITQVEKALKSFDSTSEWADLISALGKLNKVLLAHVKYPVIPKRVTIGKRLAQCLHPALPSGVHMKALETYDIIFKCIGTERLAQDLFIYSAGLFPLLSYAAMNVKPILLMIYERHFVSLGLRIKPGLNGLLLGLLPGLEEGSEFYDHTNGLLEDFCEGTGPVYFYTCLWEGIHSCPSARLPAITYLLGHFNKKKSMEDQLDMMGLNINLMIEALCNAIQDTSVLVQRSLLDFLLIAFPLHNSQLTHSDMAKVVQASINVLLRRDMSLNRRLYAWLLGTSAIGSVMLERKQGEAVDSESSYFLAYSKDLLVQALKRKLGEKSHRGGGGGSLKINILKPFRIVISLLDKPEIGPVILENVLLSIFRCLFMEFERSKEGMESQSTDRHGKSDSDDRKSAYEELLKTANLLFGTFEPFFIWDYAARMFNQACVQSGKKTVKRQDSSRKDSTQEVPDLVTITELCQLVSFLLDIVSLETFSETQTEHLPKLLCSVITSLCDNCDKVTNSEIIVTLQLCTKLLSKVQPTMITPGSHDLAGSHDLSGSHGTSHGLVERVEVHINNKKTLGHAVKALYDIATPMWYNIVSSVEIKQPEPVLSVEEALALNKKLKAESQSDKGVSEPEGRENDQNENYDTKDAELPIKVHSTALSGDKSNETETQSSDKTNKTGSQSRKNSRQNSSITLMQHCIEGFQHFFHVLVNRKLLTDCQLSEKCFEDLLKRDDYYDDIREFQDDVMRPTITVRNCEKEAINTFVTACQLLVEFASFPVYGEEIRVQTNDDQAELPQWVKDLLISSCYVDNFQVQTSAISTILDLIILTQSVNSESTGSQSTQNQTISVKILPSLRNADLHYVEEKMNFHEQCVGILWNFLNESTPQYHQTTVKLFHILHQVSPTSWLCENVIGSQLVHEDEKKRVDAFKKFTVLWHLTRNKKTGVIPGKPLRTFDRSMFVVLDSLKEDFTSVKAIATTWLTHVIQQGDISRVMEPLLLMLLHPDTARVSVQHVNINKARKVQLSESSDENIEANIYAISSEGGNVIYHVGPTKDSFKPKAKEDLKSYALTVLSGGETSIASMRSRSVQELHFDKVDPSNLNLKINPFGSENSLDRMNISGSESMMSSSMEIPLNRVKRLDKQTCMKEGISFESLNSGIFSAEDPRLNGVNSHTDNTSTQMLSSCDSIDDYSEDIVRFIIDDLVGSVVKDEKRDESGSNNITGVPAITRTPRPISLRSDSITSSNPDHDLFNSVNHRESGIDSPTPSEQNVSIFKDVRQKEEHETTDIHTLHMHMLLYTQKYDYQRTMYALSTLKSMLAACPRLMVTSLVTTSISSLRAPQLASLQLLLARHRKSVFGKNFFGEIPAEVMSNYRSSMFVEILISVCLYFIRGYYPNLMVSKLTSEELLGNKQVHIIATETLTLLMSEVISITKDSGKNFTSYIGDLLQKCKVQKALLHCTLAVIYNSRKKSEKDWVPKITETIVTFNEEDLDPSSNETYQIKLLNLLLIMIILEDQIGNHGISTTDTSTMDWDRLRVSYTHSLSNIRYTLGHPIVQQGMFVSAILSALKQHHLCHMHQHWIALVTSSLPYMGKHLPGIIMTVVSQLCRNIDILAAEYESKNTKGLEKIPPDHVITILDGLMTLCHYCLLDNISPVSIGQSAPSPLAITPTITSGNILTNLFNVFNPVGGSKETSPQRELGAVSPVLDARTNLLSILPRIIASLTSMWHAMAVLEGQEDSPKLTMGPPKTVRQYILEFISPISLPHGTHLLGAIAVAWNDRRKKSHIKHMKKVVPPPCTDQLLLVDLVSAIRVLPVDTLIQTVKQVLKQPPSSELSRTKKSVPLEVNLLQFFYAYVQNTAASQLLDSWPSLLVLLRDALQISLVPSGQFLLLLILNEFVQKTPTTVDKKHQKEIKEICQTLMEAVSSIAGSSLEQTTWLRKNYAVKPGIQSDEVDIEDTASQTKTEDVEEIRVRRVAEIEPTASASSDCKYSVQALSLLAELTAPILDIIYSSEEKEKVATFLTTLLYNIFPYLKNHSSNNLPSLRAGSQFLASVSSYQYTRKSWRKEALELLLDPSFFQMDVTCINYWITIVDNLMTHDKTTYKDLMARVSTTQSASLNLFSNKEAEIDLRAGMMKRLSFTIFCSEADQYQKSVPEIQEKLAESLRFPQAPSVMAQVFLTFRVLIMRISPQHLTSMWPTIITELIHVFLQIEQELSSETEEFVTQVQRIAALDSSWAHLGNGLNAHNNPSWLQLYLSACKLLDLCLVLPADKVPQFQLYRWAFIGGASAGEGEVDMEEEEQEEEDPKRKRKKKAEVRYKRSSFKPHIIRLARLLNMKLQGDVPVMKMTPGRPLLTFTYLRSLTELQPFFNTLCLANQTDNLLMAARHIGANISEKKPDNLMNGHSSLKPEGKGHFERKTSLAGGMPKSRSAPSMDATSNTQESLVNLHVETDKQFIEEVIKRDFIESMPY